MIGVATTRQGQARRATPKCFDCFEWRCRLSITRRRLDVDDHFRSIVLRSIWMPRSVQNRARSHPYLLGARLSIRCNFHRLSFPIHVYYIYIYIQESFLFTLSLRKFFNELDGSFFLHLLLRYKDNFEDPGTIESIGIPGKYANKSRTSYKFAAAYFYFIRSGLRFRAQLAEPTPLFSFYLSIYLSSRVIFLRCRHANRRRKSRDGRACGNKSEREREREREGMKRRREIGAEKKKERGLGWEIGLQT